MQGEKMDTKMIVKVLLVLNLLLLIYIAFIKKDAVRLETQKVWWSANMTLVQQLYNSEAYKSQQTQAIQQVLTSISQPTQANPLAQPTAAQAQQTAPTATAPTATK